MTTPNDVGAGGDRKPATLAAPGKRVRDQIREHLIPANTILGFSLALVSLADVMVPALLPWVVGLRNVAMVVVAALIFSAFYPKPLDRLLVRLGFKPEGDEGGQLPMWQSRAWRVLFLAGCGLAVALSATMSKADAGGVIASRFPSVRSVQEQLFGLQQQVARAQQGVDQTNRTLDEMNTRERAREAQASLAPISIGLLELQGAGLPARPGAPWPVRLAVYANATGIDFSHARLLLAHGPQDDTRRVQPLAAGLGAAPGAAQLLAAVPADTRWVAACLLLPDSGDPLRRALIHRWHAEPGPDGLRLRPDGAARLHAADDPACAP